jgi:hypothetical protein
MNFKCRILFWFNILFLQNFGQNVQLSSTEPKQTTGSTYNMEEGTFLFECFPHKGPQGFSYFENIFLRFLHVMWLWSHHLGPEGSSLLHAEFIANFSLF